MNESYLIASVANCLFARRDDVREALDVLAHEIAGALRRGETVSVRGLGKFKTVTRAARQGRNPATGQPIAIPAKIGVKFTPSSKLLDAMDDGR
jgi:DNA-binding protein HU-beta